MRVLRPYVSHYVKHDYVYNTPSTACRHRMPQIACTKNFVKYGHVVFEMCQMTDSNRDGHTVALIAMLSTPPERGNGRSCSSLRGFFPSFQTGYRHQRRSRRTWCCAEFAANRRQMSAPIFRRRYSTQRSWLPPNHAYPTL